MGMVYAKRIGYYFLAIYISCIMRFMGIKLENGGCKLRTLSYFSLLIILLCGVGCVGENPSNKKKEEKAKLTVIDPQHFHAALVQKHIHPGIDSVVHLFADSSATVE